MSLPGVQKPRKESLTLLLHLFLNTRLNNSGWFRIKVCVNTQDTVGSLLDKISKCNWLCGDQSLQLECIVPKDSDNTTIPHERKLSYFKDSTEPVILDKKLLPQYSILKGKLKEKHIPLNVYDLMFSNEIFFDEFNTSVYLKGTKDPNWFFSKIEGTLYLSNYRILFIESKMEEIFKGSGKRSMSIPLTSIHYVERRKVSLDEKKKDRMVLFTLRCKDVRVVHFGWQDKVQDDDIQTFSKYLSSENPLFTTERFCFFNLGFKESSSSNGWRRNIIESECVRFGISKSGPKWSILNKVDVLTSQSNKMKNVSLPKQIIIPSAAVSNVDFLSECIILRNKGRIPILTWANLNESDPNFGGSILLRGDRPKVSTSVSEYERQYIKLILLMSVSGVSIDNSPRRTDSDSSSSPGTVAKSYSVDTPKTNATTLIKLDADTPKSSKSKITNKIKRHSSSTRDITSILNQEVTHKLPVLQVIDTGDPDPNLDEKFKDLAEFSYIKLPKIVELEQSFNTLFDLCVDNFSHLEFDKLVHDTLWPKYITRFLTESLNVVTRLRKSLFFTQGIVLIQNAGPEYENETPIVCLVQIFVDPYYRTLEGFCNLIDKEWLQYSYPFKSMLGYGTMETDSKEKRSPTSSPSSSVKLLNLQIRSKPAPIFVLFLNCIWEVMQQQSHLFEFNENFLLFLLDSLYDSRFGNFFEDSDEYRMRNYSKKTTSIWSYVLSEENRPEFISPLYHNDRAILTPFVDKPSLWSSYFFRYQDRCLLGSRNFQNACKANIAKHGQSVPLTSSVSSGSRLSTSSRISLTTSGKSGQRASPSQSTEKMTLFRRGSRISRSSSRLANTADVDEIFSSNSIAAEKEENRLMFNDSDIYDFDVPSFKEIGSYLTVFSIKKSRALYTIPSSITNLTNLKHLILENNHISYIPEVVGNHLTSITNLNLRGNQIQGIHSSLSQLVNLKFLYLSNNILSSLPPNLCDKMHSIQTISLRDNRIAQLPTSFASLVSLESLDVSKNMIQIISNQVLSDLTNLVSLNLGENKLVSLPSCLPSLTNLKSLNLESNKFRNPTSSTASILNTCTFLLELDISNTELSSHLGEFFSTLTNLQSLGVRSCRIKEIPSTISMLGKLKKLHLHDNEISSLPISMIKLTELQKLYLAKNKLEYLTPMIGLYPSLTQIDISSNQIDQLPLSLKNLDGKLVSFNAEKNRFSPSTPNTPSVSPPSIVHASSVSPGIIAPSPSTSSPLARSSSSKLVKAHTMSPHISSPTAHSAPNTPMTPSTPSNGAVPSEALSKPSSLMDYIKTLQSNSKSLNRIRLTVMGEDNVGKTTLINKITQKWTRTSSSNQVENPDDIAHVSNFLYYPNETVNNDSSEAKLPTRRSSSLSLGPQDAITVSILDFSTRADTFIQGTLRTIQQILLSPRFLYLVVFSLSNPLSENSLDIWLQIIKQRVPKANVIVVATHVDDFKAMKNQSLEEKMKSLKSRLKQSFPSFETLMVEGFSNHDDDTVSVDSLRQKLQELILKQKFISNKFPYTYFEIEKVLQELGTNLELPVFSMNFVKKLTSYLGFDAEIAPRAVKMCSEVGSLVNFESDSVLSDWVFIDINWLAKIVSLFFKHKYGWLKSGILRPKILPVVLHDYPTYLYLPIVQIFQKIGAIHKLTDLETMNLTKNLGITLKPISGFEQKDANHIPGEFDFHRRTVSLHLPDHFQPVPLAASKRRSIQVSNASKAISLKPTSLAPVSMHYDSTDIGNRLSVDQFKELFADAYSMNNDETEDILDDEDLYIIPVLFATSRPNVIIDMHWRKSSSSSSSSSYSNALSDSLNTSSSGSWKLDRSYVLSILPMDLMTKFLILSLHTLQPLSIWSHGLIAHSNTSDSDTVLIEITENEEIPVNTNFLNQTLSRTYHHLRLQVSCDEKLSTQRLFTKMVILLDEVLDNYPDFKVFPGWKRYTSIKPKKMMDIEIIEKAVLTGKSRVTIEATQEEIKISDIAPDISLVAYPGKITSYSNLKQKAEIGKGGYAVVYKGEYQGQNVAIKKLFIDESSDHSNGSHQDGSGSTTVPHRVISDIFRAFRHEIELQGSFNHPNLVSILAVTMNPLCIVTELANYGNLYDYIHNPSKSLTWKLRVRIALDIALGIHYLHTQDPPIAHLDLKSPNILLFSIKPGDGAPCAKLTDFGTSKCFYGNLLYGRLVDNPVWLAPEILEGKGYELKVDIYAFGVILWELSTRKSFFGEVPFMAELEKKVIFGERPPLPPDDQSPLIFRDVIKKCWVNNPLERPFIEEVIPSISSLQGQEFEYEEELENPPDDDGEEVDEEEDENDNSNFVIDTAVSKSLRKKKKSEKSHIKDSSSSSDKRSNREYGDIVDDVPSYNNYYDQQDMMFQQQNQNYYHSYYNGDNPTTTFTYSTQPSSSVYGQLYYTSDNNNNYNYQVTSSNNARRDDGQPIYVIGSDNSNYSTRRVNSNYQDEYTYSVQPYVEQNYYQIPSSV
eukprot:TRINITY_DN4057_c0_g1_i2.p1 TRINITY_DN4057_c0_g1~~TRINITY_DN4057_c0_g1_i2.p1  ORF type:complete len:2474 (-),score=525.58 TRINITY_DN4057_c0_g1_i2:159-7580(-)